MGTEQLDIRVFNAHRIATSVHDAGGTDVVVFCHGFKGVKTGPSRYFVRAARLLGQSGISSMRFDQYGSGDSDGEFEESSFNDWIATTQAIVEHYLAAGLRVALFGQSMGGGAAIAVAAEVAAVTALVAWSTGAFVDAFVPSPTGLMEEEGQRVRESYWREAYEAEIADRFAHVLCPAYLVFGTADELVNEASRIALMERAQSHHRVDVFDGLAHSAWSYAQAEEIIARSCAFLRDALQ